MKNTYGTLEIIEGHYKVTEKKYTFNDYIEDYYSSEPITAFGENDYEHMIKYQHQQ